MQQSWQRREPFEVCATATDGEVMLRGELDAYTAPRLSAVLSDLVRERGAGKTVLDLSALDFIDLAGVGVLVTGQNDARLANGEVVLRGPTHQTRKILEITGLTQVFAIEN